MACLRVSDIKDRQQGKMMGTSNIRKKALWLVGTLLIGALGSGLWEAALKPSLYWVGVFFLDVATLGLASLRDGLYADAAKGSYERASVMIMALLFGFFSGAIFAAAIKRWVRTPSNNSNSQTMTRTRRLLPIAIAIAYSIILLIQCFRIMYIVRASNHLDQMTRIVSPYVSERELLSIDSRIARMSTRTEYLKITAELYAIARREGIAPPTFNIY